MSRTHFSTLRDLAAAEQFALLSFRHESIQSGETEWIPYVSEAQAVVNAQLERFASLPPSSPATAARVSTSRSPTEHSAVAGSAGGSAPIPGTLAGRASPPKPVVKDTPTAELNALSGAGSTSAGSSSNDAENVGAGAAESAPIASAAAGAGDAVVASEAGLFRFFQSCDGQKAFLHPLNMRQLLDDAEKGLPLPERIDAKVGICTYDDVPFLGRTVGACIGRLVLVVSPRVSLSESVAHFLRRAGCTQVVVLVEKLLHNLAALFW